MFNSIEKKDIDLLAAYNRKTISSPYAKGLKLAILPLCLVLIIGSVYVVQMFRIASVNDDIVQTDKDIKEYEKKIASSGSDAYDLFIEMSNKNENIETTINNIKSYPRLTTDLMSMYMNYLLNGLSLQSLTFSDGVINLSATATNVLTIEDYVRKLRNTNLFSDVHYDGYQSTETSTTVSSDDADDVTVTSSAYVFEVTCIMKGVSE